MKRIKMKPDCTDCKYSSYSMMSGCHCKLYPTKDIDTPIHNNKKVSCKRFGYQEGKYDK